MRAERASDEAAQREREDRLRPKITTTPAASEAWELAAEGLRAVVPDSTYRIWFEDIACIGEVNGALALAAPDQRRLSWLLAKYRSLLGDAVRDHTGYRGAFLFLTPPPSPSDDEGML